MNIFFNFLVDKSKLFIFLLIVLSLISLLGLPKFQLDASSDTLLLDNDPDLKTYRENSRKYGSSDFLVIAFTPNKDIFTIETVSLLKNLVEDLKKVNGIKNVLSLFDVPLLKYSEQSISELAEKIRRELGASKNLIKHVSLPTKMTLTKYPTLNNQKTYLKVTPKVNLETGIKLVCENIKKRIKK